MKKWHEQRKRRLQSSGPPLLSVANWVYQELVLPFMMKLFFIVGSLEEIIPGVSDPLFSAINLVGSGLLHFGGAMKYIVSLR